MEGKEQAGKSPSFPHSSAGKFGDAPPVQWMGEKKEAKANSGETYGGCGFGVIG